MREIQRKNSADDRLLQHRCEYRARQSGRSIVEILEMINLDQENAERLSVLRSEAPWNYGSNMPPALVERHADPLLLAPDDMAWPLQFFGQNNECEAIRNVERSHNFKRCPGL